MVWNAWQHEIVEKEGEEHTIYQLADKIGKTAQTVRRYMDRNELPYKVVKKSNDVYTDQQIKAIEDALEAGGKTHQAIADELGVSRSVVSAVSSGRRTQRGEGKQKTKNAKGSEKAAEAFKKVFG